MADVPQPPPEFETMRQLDRARAAWRPVQRAVRYATFDAWSLAVFAVVSVLPCLFGGWMGTIVGIGLGVAAAVEFLAVRRLRRLDPAALRPLILNQLGLALGLLLYAGWNLYLTSQDRGLAATLTQAVGEQADMATLGTKADARRLDDSVRRMVYLLYGSLAVIGPGYTAATAWFYAARRRPLATYLATAPAWAIQLHREQGFI